MYGVNIDKGPKNWQILQQHDGFATAELKGHIEFEDEVFKLGHLRVFVRIVEENSGSRVCEPVIADLDGTNWKASVKIPAGGPYRLETYLRFNKNWERRGDRVFHLGVGDNYVICGQSNAVGVAKDTAADAVDLNVHMYRNSGLWDVASHPLNDSTDSHFLINAETVQCGASPWLNFGKILSKKLGYPIGLIPTAVGGVSLATWNRKEDGRYFKNMLQIINECGSDIKGVLWSQGCHDSENENERNTYLERFCDVCKDFESVFYKGVPILTVQINKVVCTKYLDEKEQAANFAVVREAQRQAANKIENVYLAPSVDLMVCDGIHNSAMSVLVIGERVANLALKYVYGKSAVCDSPDIISATRDKNRVILKFSNVYDQIDADCNEPHVLMFSVTDSKGRIEPCDYECPGDDRFILIFDRDIEGDATVSCDRQNDTGLMPYELFSYLPVIPFNKFNID